MLCVGQVMMLCWDALYKVNCDQEEEDDKDKEDEVEVGAACAG